MSFCGYRVSAALAPRSPAVLAEGRRATPCAMALSDAGWIAASVEDFWQNFPKALRWEEGMLGVGLKRSGRAKRTKRCC